MTIQKKYGQNREAPRKPLDKRFFCIFLQQQAWCFDALCVIARRHDEAIHSLNPQNSPFPFVGEWNE